MSTRLMLVALVLGGVFLYLGIQEFRLSQYVRDEPQAITLKELIDHGPGDNHHILLREFDIGSNYVATADKSGKTTGTVWIPLRPPIKNDEVIAVKPSDIHVIAKLHDEAALTRLNGQDQKKIDGVVVNKIESLGSKEREILEQSYRGADINNCYIIEEGRHQGMGAKVAGELIGGAALLVVFLGFALFKLRRG